MWGTPPPTALDPAVGPPPERTEHAAARRLVLTLGAALGAAALGILLQLALANPAGAATPPLSGLTSAVEPPVVSPVVSTLGQTVGGVGHTAADAGAATTPVVQGVASAVESTTTAVLPVGPVLGAVTQPISTVGGDLSDGSAAGLPLPVGSLTGPLSSGTGGPAPASRLGSPLTVGLGASTPTITVPAGATPVANPFGPILSAATGTVSRVLSAAAASLTSFTLVSGATPGHSPAPRPPAAPFFPSPLGATSEASSPSHGGSPLDALPPVSLLLPALIALGVLLGRQRNPLLLFDMRAAPPG